MPGLPVDLIDWRFGRSGLLVYILGLMGIAMFSLQRSLVSRYSETARAWYGMAGGLRAWSVIEIGAVLDNRPVSGAATMVVLMMGALVTVLLWRPHLPQGARWVCRRGSLPFSEWRTQGMWAALAVTLLATAAFYILAGVVL